MMRAEAAGLTEFLMPDSKKSQKSPSPSQSSSSSRTSASNPKQGSQRSSSTPIVKDLQPRKDPSGGGSPHNPKGDY
jgi:hypothetical protein